MAIPQGRGAHVDQHLTNIVLDYQPQGFIAERVFPVVPVPHQSDAIPSFDQEDTFRIPTTRRSRAGLANEVEFHITSSKYYAENYAVAHPIAVEDRVNADPWLVRHHEEGVARKLRDILMLDSEKRIAGLVTTVGNVGTSATVASAWSSLSVADPLGDLWTLMDHIEDGTGYRPNVVIFSGLSWRLFRRNDTVISKTNPQGGVSGGAPSASREEVARLLEVREVLVGGAFENTANEAKAMSLSRIWGDNVVVGYVPEGPSIMEPSAGYTFRWAADGLPQMTVERHEFDRRRKAQLLEAGVYQDEVVTASKLLGLLQGVDSSQ